MASKVALSIYGKSERIKENSKTMQVTHTNQLEGGRPHCSIGHIRATSSWRPASDPVGEADRLEAIEALVREAQEYDADAIVRLGFEVASVKRDEIDGIPLR